MIVSILLTLTLNWRSRAGVIVPDPWTILRNSYFKKVSQGRSISFLLDEIIIKMREKFIIYLYDKKVMAEETPTTLRKVWEFLKVRKIWWITPLILLLLLFILSYIAGDSLSVTPIYAPV